MRSRIPKQQLDLLKKVPLFSSCSQGELRAIAQLGTPLGIEEGAILTTQGQPGREFFLVLDGVASCRVRNKEVKRFKKGDYFGELALLHGGRRTADVIAATAMEVLVFDAREFRAMLMTTPSIGIKMLDHLAERLTEADAQYTH
jgi:CRP/FNR family transcriptional regulator, cyclic AMP receptor protein